MQLDFSLHTIGTIKKMEAETDRTRRRHDQMKNTLQLFFGMAEERDRVRNQDLVRNTIFKLILENEDTRF